MHRVDLCGTSFLTQCRGGVRGERPAALHSLRPRLLLRLRKSKLLAARCAAPAPAPAPPPLPPRVVPENLRKRRLLHRLHLLLFPQAQPVRPGQRDGDEGPDLAPRRKCPDVRACEIPPGCPPHLSFVRSFFRATSAESCTWARCGKEKASDGATGTWATSHTLPPRSRTRFDASWGSSGSPIHGIDTPSCFARCLAVSRAATTGGEMQPSEALSVRVGHVREGCGDPSRQTDRPVGGAGVLSFSSVSSLSALSSSFSQDSAMSSLLSALLSALGLLSMIRLFC